MALLFLGLIILVVGGIVFSLFPKAKIKTVNGDYITTRNASAKLSLIMAIVVFLVCAIGSCFCSVTTGHTGIVTTFGRVEDYTYDAGIHFKAPWMKVVQMDNRIQKSTINLSCFSSDIQEVNTVYSLNYQISKTNAQDLYRNVGKEYYDVVIVPSISEAVKTIFAHYTAEELVGARDVLASNIEQVLVANLAEYNIEVNSTAIEDIDFTDAYTNSIEEKQVASQNKLKAETEQAQKTMEAAQEAERRAIEARAAAEVAKIQAEADLEVQKINADAAEYTGKKEAAKNEAINASLTGDLLNYYLIQQWNGVYPDTYVGSENVQSIVGFNNERKSCE